MAGISMRELADRLGVSTASVSVALRGKSGISEETRQRILEEAHRLGYDMGRLSTPDFKGMIELVDLTYRGHCTPPEDSLYYNQFLEAVSKELTGRGYQLAGPFAPSEPGFLSRPSADGGILLGAAATDDQIRQYQTLGIPFVVTGVSSDIFPANTVSHDNHAGIRSALLHLKDLGHTHIGYLRSLIMAPGEDRQQAWQYEMYRLQLTPGEVLDISNEPDNTNPEIMLGRLHDWLNRGLPKATAFLCDNDSLAAAFMRALRDKGLIPGRDISVIGFDDMPFSAFLEPPLTTVRTHEPELGIAAADLLLRCMERPGRSHWHIKVGTALVARSSVCRPPGAPLPPE